MKEDRRIHGDFSDRFDILLEKRPRGVAELRHATLYGKSQLRSLSVTLILKDANCEIERRIHIN